MYWCDSLGNVTLAFTNNMNIIKLEMLVKKINKENYNVCMHYFTYSRSVCIPR